MSKKKKRKKKPVDPYAPYRTLYWYEKDNFVPPESLVTFTDVERWKNAAHERYPSFDLVVKFRHSLDRDRNILPDTIEMAFWLAWKKRPVLPEDVDYEVFEDERPAEQLAQSLRRIELEYPVSSLHSNIKSAEVP